MIASRARRRSRRRLTRTAWPAVSHTSLVTLLARSRGTWGSSPAAWRALRARTSPRPVPPSPIELIVAPVPTVAATAAGPGRCRGADRPPSREPIGPARGHVIPRLLLPPPPLPQRQASPPGPPPPTT